MTNPLTAPPLAENEVHVWTCTLQPDVTTLAPLLSADERARAQRFRFDVHRRRFIAARATARQLLGAYVGVDAAAVRFEYEPLGKPRLVGGGASFNVSHCDDRMMIAIRRDGEVGVDIERLRPIAEAESIASSYFHPEEAEQIRQLGEPERSHVFLRHWTRHEARGKFAGQGIVPAHEFHTTITTLDLATEDQHVAAVAFGCDSEGLTCHGFCL